MVERLLEFSGGSEYTVDDHEAGCDAVARPDGGVFGVGFVYVGEYFGELGSVVGDFQDVVLCLADEIWGVAWRGGYVAGLVEPDGGPSAPLRFAQDRFPFPLICRCLWGAEGVVELLLELGDGAVGCRGGLGLGDV